MNADDTTHLNRDVASFLEGVRLTGHASIRARQRGIDLGVLDCLLSYGRREHDHRGAEVVVFDRSALQQVRRFEPPATWRAVDGTREVYAVVDSDGCVITTGHRFRRVIRDMSLSSLRPSHGRRGHQHAIRLH